MANISRETWQVALDALRANKVKAALTMLGVVIGSACIVLVVTIALIGKTYVLAADRGRRLQHRLCQLHRRNRQCALPG